VPLIKYVDTTFTAKTEHVITLANQIIDEYQAQGFTLTVRQLYYQFVARGHLPNTEPSYKRLGNIVSDARRAGLLDWDAIEDRTRYVRENSHWDHPRDVIRSAYRGFRLDKWKKQRVHPEVWIEKDALIGVIEDVCKELDVSYFSCRGYVSDSEMWSAGRRIIDNDAAGQDTVIFHLGDHDPSGIDMTRDIEDRLRLFGEGLDFKVVRLALNMDQVEEYNPPPNPAKTTDSRYAGYIAVHGEYSWELDALDPPTLAALVRDAIEELRDEDRWIETNALETLYKVELGQVVSKWADIVEFLHGRHQ
jgi:hypothetical protein